MVKVATDRVRDNLHLRYSNSDARKREPQLRLQSPFFYASLDWKEKRRSLHSRFLFALFTLAKADRVPRA